MQLHLNLKTFEYQHHYKVRTVMLKDDPWFCLADLCGVLDVCLENARDALDLDEMREEDIPGLPSELVNESGMYTLIFQSGTREAKAFRKWITAEVIPQIRRTGSYSIQQNRIPIFVRRFNENWDRVSPGYFSVINELFIRVYGKLEHAGHTLRDRALNGREIRPDVSVGQHFSKWLKKYHPLSVPRRRNYLHVLPDGKEVEAYQYPIDMLPMFIEFVDTVWLPDCAPDYLSKRDPAALPYLPKILAPSAKPRMLAE